MRERERERERKSEKKRGRDRGNKSNSFQQVVYCVIYEGEEKCKGR